MAQLLDGKLVAESIYQKILLEMSLLGVVPKIVLIIVGDDAASQTYVRMKQKKCEDLGIMGETCVMPSNTSEEEILKKIDELNLDSAVHGILIQLPLPSKISKLRVMKRIHPLKDVDCFHPENSGLLWQNQPRFVPCTPAGILEMLKFYKIPMVGQNAVVLGRSEIVGKPMAHLLSMQDATVTVCHSKTKDIEQVAQRADILIAAIGKPQFVKGSWVKEGAVVVDVGIHRVDGKIIGDVCPDVELKASHLSPVPGGVGPLTIAMLMKNVIDAAKYSKGFGT